MYGDKTLSIKVIYWIIKAGEAEKQPIWQKALPTLQLLLPLHWNYLWWNCQHRLHQEDSDNVSANFRLKRSRLSSQDWFLFRDEVLVHSAISVQESHSPNIATVDFFLFWKVKPELAGLSLSQDIWGGANHHLRQCRCCHLAVDRILQ